MRDLLNLLFWIVIIGLFAGSIQISQDPVKMEAPFEIGDDVTRKVTSEDFVNGAVTDYIVIKVRWSYDEKWRFESYTVQYKDEAGEIESFRCKPELLSKRAEVEEEVSTEPQDPEDYVKSLIEGTN